MGDIANSLYTEDLLLEKAKSFKIRSDYRCQFLCKGDLCIDNIDYQNDFYATSKTGNATILYVNMVILGLSEIIAINERLIYKIGKKDTSFSKIHRSPTHHVIPMELRNASIIKKLDICLNDGRNGIILPHGNNRTLNFATGAPHSGSHPEYTKKVERRIANCQNEDELWAIVDGLKWELYEDKIELN